MADDPKPDDKPAEKKVALVKMKRDPKEYTAPHSADVHPDELSNFARGGWVKA
jgi:hypothetical protein